MLIRRVENELEGGYTLRVYPVGEEIENLETDTSKVCISYGQASPMSGEEVYTKNKTKQLSIDRCSIYIR